ncbi:hypothetical protein DBV39_02790 [Orrella marina]|uniref:Uncharacterized protein n=1 Tax=Orrella marina TaxID=2163011 RepID=A0A2R4XG76_9BURK|nr:hypothetical protein DBV39_02790 [Orrella marina]
MGSRTRIARVHPAHYASDSFLGASLASSEIGRQIPGEVGDHVSVFLSGPRNSVRSYPHHLCITFWKMAWQLRQCIDVSTSSLPWSNSAIRRSVSEQKQQCGGMAGTSRSLTQQDQQTNSSSHIVSATRGDHKMLPGRDRHRSASLPELIRCKFEHFTHKINP